ncbi:solute carrier family 22 member 3-like [Pectinophora gossypiella]|uniref:solute carrier family 22 member 3-like n=1 Tax=Pectinophora gossypiella TaxID=13191 RepID=UPI00214E6CA8|nr:solute carrier family 22 member 3-like [Pectinophora gossypiella]
MIGLLAMGPLSDRIGRKCSIVISGLIGATFGILRSFTSWYWMYIALEFIEAAFGDVASSIFMLSIEMVAPDKRILFQMWCAAGFAFGFIVLPVAAWQVPYWRNLLRVIYSPALLFILYLFLIDESPRWLLSRGKKDKAIAIINKIAKTDKVAINKDILENISSEKYNEIPLSKLLKNTLTSKTLLKIFLICITWWSVSTFVNYGIQINSVSIEGNKYVIFGLISVSETAANIITTYSMIGFRRKIPLVLSFFLAGLSCFVQPFLPNNIPWLTITVYMFGKLMASIFFYITYLYTSELFPTYTRNTMHSLCSSIGRIGSIIAPQTPLLGPLT